MVRWLFSCRFAFLSRYLVFSLPYSGFLLSWPHSPSRASMFRDTHPSSTPVFPFRRSSALAKIPDGRPLTGSWTRPRISMPSDLQSNEPLSDPYVSIASWVPPQSPASKVGTRLACYDGRQREARDTRALRPWWACSRRIVAVDPVKKGPSQRLEEWSAVSDPWFYAECRFRYKTGRRTCQGGLDAMPLVLSCLPCRFPTRKTLIMV